VVIAHWQKARWPFTGRARMERDTGGRIMENELGGIKIGAISYVVSKIPGMVRLQLCRMEGNTIKPVAGFRDNEDAYRFADWLQQLASRCGPKE
jgi:hypothetical protein